MPNRIVTLIVVAALATILGTLEARIVGAPPLLTLLMGAGIGVAWAAVAMCVAALLGRRRTAGHWPDASAMLAAFVSTVLLAGGIVSHLMFHTPEMYLTSQQNGTGDGLVFYYVVLNPLTEWVLVPFVLLCNWASPARRRLALAAAVVYYGERVSTYLYFAPNILSWKHATVTPELLVQVSLWLQLDTLRILVNLVMIVLFALITYQRASVQALPGERRVAPAEDTPPYSPAR